MGQTNDNQSKSNTRKNEKKRKIKRITTMEEKKEIEKNRLSYLKRAWILLGGK